MKLTKMLGIVAAFAVAFSARLDADEKGTWTFAIKGGIAEAISGDVHRGPSFDGSVLLALDPGSLPVDVDAKGFDDVHGTFTELGLEGQYHLNQNLSWLIGLSNTRGSGGSLRVGTVGADLPLIGRFGDYDDMGLYTGIKYVFTGSSAWRPYVSANIGYRNVDEIRASFSVPDVTFVAPFNDALTNAPFYDDSDILAVGFNLGLVYQASEDVRVGIETGTRFQGSLDDNDSVLDVLGLGALNDEGDLTLMPIRIFANFKF